VTDVTGLTHPRDPSALRGDAAPRARHDAPSPAVAPTLVFAVGNPSRGDDALGPLLLERLRALMLPDVELLEDFQLQPEHALDLAGRDAVVVVDADTSGPEPFCFTAVAPGADRSVTTHALSPAALLDVYRRVVDAPLPPTWLLAIRGHAFELGAPLSAQAAANLDAATAMLSAWLDGSHDGGEPRQRGR
jgi:hydrogenase maturation protease